MTEENAHRGSNARYSGRKVTLVFVGILALVFIVLTGLWLLVQGPAAFGDRPPADAGVASPDAGLESPR